MSTDTELDGLASLELADTLAHLRDTAAEAMTSHEQQVRRELKRMRVREEAKALYRREQEGERTPLDVASLAELTQREPDAEQWRVEGLMPADGSTLVTAQRKAGKTTFALNLARAVVVGERFLDAFDVTPITGNVGFLNFEVSPRMIGAWADDAGIPHQRFFVANLRGRANPLSHPDDRKELARLMRAANVEMLIVDPFANAFTGESVNDAHEVGAFLRDLATFAREECGARDLVVTNHAGWVDGRSRNSSAIEDWPDALVRLTTDSRGNRFLSAIGRDVDVPEGALVWDGATRSLTLDRTANRWAQQQAEALNALVADVVSVVEESPGLGSRAIQDELTARGVTYRKGDVAPAIASAAARELIEVRPEARGKKACYPLLTARENDRPQEWGQSPGTVPTVPHPFRGGTVHRDSENEEPRGTVGGRRPASEPGGADSTLGAHRE